jgi:predicted nucleic acid-binding protein
MNHAMQILVSDANVLIDIEHGDLIRPMFNLKTTFVVPDVLFEKELKARHAHFLDFGLKIKSLSDQAVDKASALAIKYRQPSRIDLFALSLALQEKCPLLTGDKNLRKAADQEGVTVYGTIWLVSEMLRKKIVQPTLAHTAFQKMKGAGSRLPWGDVDKLFKL